MGVFWHYVEQCKLKHSGGRVSDRLVADYAFPPAHLNGELVVKFNQQVLVKMAGGDRMWQLILITAYQAPDNPWCFLETLLPFVRGVKAQRRGNAKQAKQQFDEVGRVLRERYVRGISPKDLASGKRKGTVNGFGDVGLYSAEHRTAILPGKSHPDGLRWKLEHWPHWVEHGLFPLIDGWPRASDAKAIDALLEDSRFAAQFPKGIQTGLVPRLGAPPVPIVELFGGDEAYTRSVLSQALLFQEMLRPTDKEKRRLRERDGWGVGPFTVRGLWMEHNKFPTLNRSFPCFDTSTFCPGFVGALGGIKACDLERRTGVSLTTTRKGTIAWSKWHTQVRFAAWLHSLQASNPSFNMHCTEAEATLCFFLRYFKMRRSGAGQEFGSAARAIGLNHDPKVVKMLYDQKNIDAAKKIIFGR